MFRIRDKNEGDNDRLTAAWTSNYGAPVIVARGRKHDPRQLRGYVAEEEGTLRGAVTFARQGDEIEVITLDSFVEDLGVATALLAAVSALAKAEGARRLCLVTTNDNIRAIRFYQKRGWNVAALHPNAVEAARRIKPQIPLIGDHGIPIRDEIEFELLLA